MRFILKIVLALFVFSVCNYIMNENLYLAGAQENIIRAKIGIQIRSGDNAARAKSQDSLQLGDLLRIYVHPEKNSHIYVVHSDLKKATLLNVVQQEIQSSTLVMPSLQEFYQVDGKSEKEIFTIVISPDVLTEITDLLRTGNAPHLTWVRVEKRLIGNSQIDLAQDVERPFPLAGNVRGVGSVGDVDPFVNQLQIFSGKSILIKKYEFEVKK